jgi:hypothetical protein
MNSDLGFTATVFGWGAGIFFFGYFFFEVPSNLAGRWRILIDQFEAARQKLQIIAGRRPRR